MAHKITMKAPKDSLVNRDVIFIVQKNGKKLGELRVSKGSIDWKPFNSQYTHYMSWRDFSQLMSNGGEVVIVD